MITNQHVSRTGTWIHDPSVLSDDELLKAGRSIGSEINSLRSVIEHNYDSNRLITLSSLSAIIGGILSMIRIKTMKRKEALISSEAPPFHSKS